MTTAMNFNKPTQLYRHYDGDGVLLYVGISLNTIGRLAQHKFESGWFNQIASITITTYQSRKEALDAEAEAIEREAPVFNVINNARVKPSVTFMLREGFERKFFAFLIAWHEVHGEKPVSARELFNSDVVREAFQHLRGYEINKPVQFSLLFSLLRANSSYYASFYKEHPDGTYSVNPFNQHVWYAVTLQKEAA